MSAPTKTAIQKMGISLMMPVAQALHVNIDLDSFVSTKTPKEKSTPILTSQIIAMTSTNIPEEEKESNFGDYGPESESLSENDDN